MRALRAGATRRPPLRCDGQSATSGTMPAPGDGHGGGASMPRHGTDTADQRGRDGAERGGSEASPKRGLFVESRRLTREVSTKIKLFVGSLRLVGTVTIDEKGGSGSARGARGGVASARGRRREQRDSNPVDLVRGDSEARGKLRLDGRRED